MLFAINLVRVPNDLVHAKTALPKNIRLFKSQLQPLPAADLATCSSPTDLIMKHSGSTLLLPNAEKSTNSEQAYTALTGPHQSSLMPWLQGVIQAVASRFPDATLSQVPNLPQAIQQMNSFGQSLTVPNPFIPGDFELAILPQLPDHKEQSLFEKLIQTARQWGGGIQELSNPLSQAVDINELSDQACEYVAQVRQLVDHTPN